MAVSITEFQLDEFRGGNPLQVLDLGSGLNVALVRTEASRADLLQVVPWVFYGPGNYFPRATRQAAGNGTVGDAAAGPSGIATVHTDHGVFQIARDRRDGNSSPRIMASDGQVCPPEYLHNILEGLPRKTYREVFTFDLDRMARMVRGDDRSVAKLTRLAIYLQRKSPQASPSPVETNWIQDFRGVHQRLGELTQLVTSSTEANRESSRPEGPQANRDEIKGQLRKLDDEITTAKAKQKHIQEEMDEAQSAMTLNRVQLRLHEIERELADVRPTKQRSIGQVSEDAAARLDDKIAAAKSELQELHAEAEELRQQGRELGNLSQVAALVPQIEALLLQEKAILREEATVEQLETKIQDLQSRLEAERVQLRNLPANHHRPANGLLDAQLATRMDVLSQRLKEAERELQVSEDRYERAEAAGQLHPENFARASAIAASPDDAVALHEAEQQVVYLSELLELDDQLLGLEQDRDELDHQVRRLYARQLMPFRMTIAMGVPFMIGVAMIIYGLVMSAGVTNWQLVLLGFTATIASAMVKITIDRSTGDLLQSARRRLSRVNFQIDEINSAREESATSGISLGRQLEEAQREVSRLQTRFAARADELDLDTAPRTQGVPSPETARIQLNEARRRHQELNQQWRELMLEMGWSANLTPAQARESLSDHAWQATSRPEAKPDDTRLLEVEIQHLESDMNRRREWLSMLTGQTRQLIKELGLGATGTTAVEQLDLLRETLQEHKEHMQTRRQLLRSLKRLKQKRLRIKENGRRLTDQRRRLDDDQLLKKEQQKTQQKLVAERIKLLEKQREELKLEIAEIRDRYGIAADSPLVELSDEELTARWDSLKSKLSRLGEQLIKTSEQRGRLRSQLKLPEQSPAAAPSSTWKAVVEKARELAHECQLSTQVAAETTPPATVGQQRYQYLDDAARHLSLLTQGQFVRIDVTEDQQLLLQDQHGQVANLSEVRREHFANLYFSMWLARLECFADRGLQLPIVMEDPLDATPPTRRSEVAQMIRDYATSGHQIILITSDNGNAQLFSQLDVPLADFSDRESLVVGSAQSAVHPQKPAHAEADAQWVEGEPVLVESQGPPQRPVSQPPSPSLFPPLE